MTIIVDLNRKTFICLFNFVTPFLQNFFSIGKNLKGCPACKNHLPFTKWLHSKGQSHLFTKKIN